MIDDLFIEMEATQFTKTGQAACGDDVQLLDIMMPKLDGISTIARLRETSNVPVIMLTAPRAPSPT